MLNGQLGPPTSEEVSISVVGFLINYTKDVQGVHFLKVIAQHHGAPSTVSTINGISGFSGLEMSLPSSLKTLIQPDKKQSYAPDS